MKMKYYVILFFASLLQLLCMAPLLRYSVSPILFYFFTVTASILLSVAPSLSVMVKVTVYSPGSE